MNKIFKIGAAFALTIASAAAAQKSGYEEFDRVAEMYKRGKHVSAAELEGWYSGRCYNYFENENTPEIPIGRPKRPLNGFLWVQKSESGSYYGGFATHWLEGADFYDTMNDERRARNQRFLDKWIASEPAPLDLTEKPLVMADVDAGSKPGEPGDLIVKIKRFKDTPVAKITCRPGTSVCIGETNIYRNCEFKKVRFE